MLGVISSIAPKRSIDYVKQHLFENKLDGNMEIFCMSH